MTDALGENRERYGVKRLQQTFDRCLELPASALIDRLTAALRAFQVGEHADDTAALALRRVARRDPVADAVQVDNPHEIEPLATSS